MTYEDFALLIMDEPLNITPSTGKEFRQANGDRDHKVWNGKKYVPNEKSDDKELYIYAKWSTGGTSGGSCWDEGDEDHHYSTSGEIEPEFDELDRILEHLAPSISFIQYKGLGRVVDRGSYSENEYYGNSTDYAWKRISLKKLHEFLEEKKLLTYPSKPVAEKVRKRFSKKVGIND